MTRKGVNKGSLSSFQLKNYFKVVLAGLAHKKQNILTSQPCLPTLLQTCLLANQSAHTISVILQMPTQHFDNNLHLNNIICAGYIHVLLTELKIFILYSVI